MENICKKDIWKIQYDGWWGGSGLNSIRLVWWTALVKLHSSKFDILLALKSLSWNVLNCISKTQYGVNSRLEYFSGLYFHKGGRLTADMFLKNQIRRGLLTFGPHFRLAIMQPQDSYIMFTEQDSSWLLLADLDIVVSSLMH